MGADGSNQTRLTNIPAIDTRPSWAPDADKIVFQSERDGNYEIYIMDADGSNRARVTDNPAQDRRASWSSDGSRIAFTSDRSGVDQIYVMERRANEPGFQPPNRLTEGDDLNSSPIWSPNDDMIAFTSSRDGYLAVYVMDTDGGNQTRITQDNVESRGADWSPDGSKIAFTSHQHDNYDVYVIDAPLEASGASYAGVTSTRLTVDPPEGWPFAYGAADQYPTWSSDSSRLIFQTDRAGLHQIYVMDADGGNQSCLLYTSPSPRDRG